MKRINGGRHQPPPPRRLLLVLLLLLSFLLALGRSDEKFDEGESNMHVHLAAGPNPSTSMAISFSSACSSCSGSSSGAGFRVLSPVGSVLIGTRPEHLHRSVTESAPSLQYSAQYLNATWYQSPYFHHITVDGLEPSTTYYYHCMVELTPPDGEFEDESSAGGGGDERRFLRPRQASVVSRKVYSFTTAPSPGAFVDKDKPVTFAFIADIGRGRGTYENFAHMQANKDNIDLLMFAGDLAYSFLSHEKWDLFFDMLAQFDVTQQRPIMVAPGNHDVDRHPLSGAMFVAYENRFRMPQIRQARTSVDTQMSVDFMAHDIPYPLDYEYGNAYYSFTYGPAHNIVLCSYCSIDPGSRQSFWLEKELKSVDRTVTPWVIVTMHSPMYTTFSKHQDDPQISVAKQYLEPLFVAYRVNLVFSGHVHGYQRSHPTVSEKVDERGPVHIIGGNGGGGPLTAKFRTREPEEWLASRDGTHYGYATLSLLNETHAYWNRISVMLNERVNNTAEGRVLPSESQDSVYIVNQYYL